jgi:hypothetical protein
MSNKLKIRIRGSREWDELVAMTPASSRGLGQYRDHYLGTSNNELSGRRSLTSNLGFRAQPPLRFRDWLPVWLCRSTRVLGQWRCRWLCTRKPRLTKVIPIVRGGCAGGSAASAIAPLAC